MEDEGTMSTISEYEDTLVYYSKDKVTQALRKHSKVKTKNYLYSVCAIIDKVIHILNTTKSVLPEKDRKWVDIYIDKLTVNLPDLVRSIDEKKVYYPNRLIKTTSANNTEIFSRSIHVDILTNDYLTYNKKMAHILHNTMMFVTLATSIVGYIENDPTWETVNETLGDLILYLDKDYTDTVKESTSIYNSMYKNMLQLRRDEEVVPVNDWDSILLNTKDL